MKNGHRSFWWECRHCGELIPYMYDFCSECTKKLLGEPPKPVDPPEREEKMKPEYIGFGNFDEDNYVYAHCRCPLTADYAIKWPRIKDGKPHRYRCTCEDCGTKMEVYF